MIIDEVELLEPDSMGTIIGEKLKPNILDHIIDQIQKTTKKQSVGWNLACNT